jgi:2-polyprenyl-3-methyl-5-hydroxy-6-metoxy-1,4-benzoquinol methylase
MKPPLEIILEKIKSKNPNHADKLLNNLSDLDEEYKYSANAFYSKYIAYLEKCKLNLNFSIDCYLHMIDDMLEERNKFIRNGKYSNTSFEEVKKTIYGNSEIMTYHMHGLVLAQFLWFDQYARFKFFIGNLKKYFHSNQKYLEIGGGHGLYADETIHLIPEISQIDLVDISQSSLSLAQGIINNHKVNYFLKNIFDFSNVEKYNFITVGEVLEHVEDPLSLLKKIYKLLKEKGVCYITTPINAPMIDHIYLFNNVEEIRNLFHSARFEVIEEKIVISEKVSQKKAEKFKVPIMYAAFIKKLNNLTNEARWIEKK